LLRAGRRRSLFGRTRGAPPLTARDPINTHSQGRGALADPTNETAFICNLETHWFTLRRAAAPAGDDDFGAAGAEGWFNFNSLFPAPQPLSPFYLATFLESLKQQGYDIFAVRGPLPRPELPAGPGPSGPMGRWLSLDEAKRANDGAAVARKRGRTLNALEEALSQSQGDGGGGAGPSGAGPGVSQEERDLAAAIAASLGGAYGGGGGGPSSSGATAAAAGAGAGGLGGWQADGGGYDSDPELAAALAASLADAAPPAPPPPPPPPQGPAPPPLGAEPAAGGPGVLQMAVRLPSGQRAVRRFNASDATGQLYAFLGSQPGVDARAHALFTAAPRREVPCSETISLEGAGLTAPQVLTAEPRSHAPSSQPPPSQ